MATNSLNPLRTLFSALYRQHRAAWSLPGPDALAQALADRADVRNAILALTRQLASGALTFAQWQSAVAQALQRAGVDVRLLAAGAALGLLAGAATRRTPEQALAALQARFEQRAVAFTRGLAQGRIRVNQWRALMAAELDVYHPAAAIAGARGSRADAVLALGRQRSASERAFLDAWADELERGGLPSEAKLVARSRLYAGAGNGTYSAGQAIGLGLPPMPAYPTQGSECMSNCLCRWDYLQLEGDGNWDCYWRTAPAEHCPTCTRRAVQWNPLRVRGGMIIR